jgi:hypothetical protein
MRFKYVGLKDIERAFLAETGIAWTPGMEADVDDAIGSRMLKHVDVWALVAEDVTAKTLADVAPKADEGANLPGWVKDGIALGLTDEHLEGIAKAGGPDSEEGEPLYKAALHEVAAGKGLALRSNASTAKIVEALKAAAK